MIYKPKQLKKNFQELENLSKKYLNKYIIAYSVKTNNHKQVIEDLHSWGSNFEVASLKEIELTPIKAKVFNGACKTEEELSIAIKQKHLINVDSISEIEKISKLVKGKKHNIGLRMSFDDSKFGFNSNEIEDIVQFCSHKNLSVIGIHSHSGTQLGISMFEENIKKIAQIINSLRKKISLKYIDIGGGFPDKNQLSYNHRTIEDYFKIIKNYLGQYSTTIILEPGRYCVSDAFDLITKVQVIKKKNRKVFAILDAGINILSKITLSRFTFELLNNQSNNISNKGKTEYILSGPLLFGNDTLGKYFGNLKEGDLLKVSNVGAYCYNLAWEISYDKPKIIIE